MAAAICTPPSSSSTSSSSVSARGRLSPNNRWREKEEERVVLPFGAQGRADREGLRSVDRVSGFLFYHKFLSFFGSLFVSGKERGAKKRRKKRALSLFFTSRTYVRASSTAHRARQVITEEEKGISLEAYTVLLLRYVCSLRSCNGSSEFPLPSLFPHHPIQCVSDSFSGSGSIPGRGKGGSNVMTFLFFDLD